MCALVVYVVCSSLTVAFIGWFIKEMTCSSRREKGISQPDTLYKHFCQDCEEVEILLSYQRAWVRCEACWQIHIARERSTLALDKSFDRENFKNVKRVES